MSGVTSEGPNRYGFVWGPMTVQRATHVEGRGYSLRVFTDHSEIQVYVSEGGRVVDAYRPGGGKLVPEEDR